MGLIITHPPSVPSSCLQPNSSESPHPRTTDTDKALLTTCYFRSPTPRRLYWLTFYFPLMSLKAAVTAALNWDSITSVLVARRRRRNKRQHGLHMRGKAAGDMPWNKHSRQGNVHSRHRTCEYTLFFVGPSLSSIVKYNHPLCHNHNSYRS